MFMGVWAARPLFFFARVTFFESLLFKSDPIDSGSLLGFKRRSFPMENVIFLDIMKRDLINKELGPSSIWGGLKICQL